MPKSNFFIFVLDCSLYRATGQTVLVLVIIEFIQKTLTQKPPGFTDKLI